MTTRIGGIASRIILLVSVSLLLATLAHFIITYSGPPPRVPPANVEFVTYQLLNPQKQPPPFHRLTLSTAQTPPSPRKGERRLLSDEAQIIARFHLPPDSVRLYATDDTGPILRGPAFSLPGREQRMTDLWGGFTMGIRTADGWHIGRSEPRPFLTSWHWTTLAWTLGLLLLLVPIAAILARAIARPMEKLAQDADAVAKDGVHNQAAIGVPTRGPPEVIRLARALEDMRERVVGHAEQRTLMLAAIAHDMGTPLARLAFRVETMTGASATAAQSDIDELRALIGSFVDFARGVPTERGPVRLDELVREAAHRLTRPDAPVDLGALPDGPVTVTGNRLALGRMLTNLVGNAQRYAGNAEIALSVEGRRARLSVSDRGPGLPDQPEKLFEPFARGEESRNRETGGAGLGLAIAREVVTAHGGGIVAANREGGGAQFIVTLPLS
jgi:signal transduction histidine kinase